jgi:serine/threonine-protein kinase RsbW
MKKEFQIPSELSEVPKASRKVLAALGFLKLSEGDLFDVRLCLEEALINAIKYGNRLRPDLTVRLVVEQKGPELKLTVEDCGEGFDTRKIEDCTREENLFKASGRGVYLIHQLMDEVKYNSKGNCLSMIKRLQNQAKV